MNPETDRRFFHSFPRAIAGESEDKTFERALSILRTIKDIGFVLAPEIIDWDNRKFFTWPPSYRLLQRRACFTELHPSELATHSKSFGPISLSLPISSLRKAGAVPAIYVPQATGDDASQLFQRSIFYLEQIRVMFRKFEAIKEAAGRDQSISLRKETIEGKLINEYFFRAKNTRQLFDYLEHSGLTMDACAATLNVIQNTFYPTDNSHSGDILGYYRQREWRLVASELFPRGQQMTHPLSPTEIEKLNAVDPRFWTKPLEYEGAQYTRSQLALKHSLSPQWSIFDHVDAIYAPSARLAEVQAVVGSNVTVTAVPAR